MASREYFKVVLLGDQSTGKTSLMKRYFLGRFNDAELPTIGAAFFSKVFVVNEKEYEMGVWDTSGQERYQAISSLYYRCAKAAIICYDIIDYRTFNRMNYWLSELRRVEESCRIYLCATKCDLLHSYEANPQLSFVKSYAVKNDAKFFMTSSLTGYNIDEMFQEVLEDCLLDNFTTPNKDIPKTIKLPSRKNFKGTISKKCCSKG